MPKGHVNLPERTERRRLIRDFKNAADAQAEQQSAPAAAAALQERLSRDMTAILRYDAGAGKSLPEVLNEERTPTVNMGGKKPEAAYGASRSQRIPMAVVDRKGGRREGFFTKKGNRRPQGPVGRPGGGDRRQVSHAGAAREAGAV